MKDRQLFDLYTDYLICSIGKATSTQMSRMLNGEISHDRISRMLKECEWTQKDYWHLIKPLVRKTESMEGIIKIDDTIENKPHSTENELICWHFDHTVGKTVKGINILNFHYEPRPGELSKFSFPLAFEIIRKTEEYYDEKTDKVKRRSEKTKNELVRNRLRVLQHYNKVKFSTVLWDTWFSSKENMIFIHKELKKTFIGAIKNNRTVALSLEAKQQGKYVGVSELDWHKTNKKIVYLNGLDFPTVLVKQVFKNKDGSSGELFLVSNDITQTYHSMTSIYQKRWGVEVLHRSLKQNVGLEQSPTQIEVTQANHIFAAMAAWVKLEFLSKKKVYPLRLQSKTFCEGT